MNREGRIAFLNEGFRRWQDMRDSQGIPHTKSKSTHFARFLNIPEGTFSRINNGDKASMENMQKLAKWYGPELYEAFGYGMMVDDWRLRRVLKVWPELSEKKQETLLHFFDEEIMGDMRAPVPA